jgi:hypothetical protein
MSEDEIDVIALRARIRIEDRLEIARKRWLACCSVASAPGASAEALRIEAEARQAFDDATKAWEALGQP